MKINKLKKIGMMILVSMMSITTFATDTATIDTNGPDMNIESQQVGTGVLINDGKSGEIYGGLRWPDFMEDPSEWLTLRLGEGGIRIVSNDNTKELIAIDNYGGIYLNGEIYTNNSKLQQGNNKVTYVILIVCLLLNVIMLDKYKKLKDEVRVMKNIK